MPLDPPLHLLPSPSPPPPNLRPIPLLCVSLIPDGVGKTESNANAGCDAGSMENHYPHCLAWTFLFFLPISTIVILLSSCADVGSYANKTPLTLYCSRRAVSSGFLKRLPSHRRGGVEKSAIRYNDRAGSPTIFDNSRYAPLDVHPGSSARARFRLYLPLYLRASVRYRIFTVSYCIERYGSARLACTDGRNDTRSRRTEAYLALVFVK